MANTVPALNGLLAGKIGLVTGVANERSIAAGCAQAFREAGAELVLTCRQKSVPFVMPVAKVVQPRLLLSLDVEVDARLKVFSIESEAHSGAWISCCTRSRSARSKTFTVVSRIARARASSVRWMYRCIHSFAWRDWPIDHYNIMGPVKAALEGTARYADARIASQEERVAVIDRAGRDATAARSVLKNLNQIQAIYRQYRLTILASIGQSKL